MTVAGYQQKRFNLKKQEAVSLATEQQRLQLGDHRWMDCTKIMRQWTFTSSGLHLAKQMYSQEDIVRVIVIVVVDSAFGFLPSQVLRERW